MNRVISCILLSVGIVLIIYGLNTLNSVATALARFVSGGPTEFAFWALIAGILAMSTGLGGLFRAPKIRRAPLRR